MSVFLTREPQDMALFEVESPYLIQRDTFKDHVDEQDITGIDSIIRWDYMGSSEFEFGALPLSLRDMCHNLKAFTLSEILDIKDKDGRSLHLISYQTHTGKVISFIDGLRRKEYFLKESSHFPEHIQGKDTYYLRTNFWWDVENHYMFCFGKDRAELVLRSLDINRKKWITSGVIQESP